MPDRRAPEVARHPDVDVAGDLVARAEAAAAGEDGEEADDGEPPHDTATSRGNASTMPACVAVSRTRPVAAGTVSVAVPSAAVVAVADPSAHRRAGDVHPAPVVVVAAHGHAQRRAGRGGAARGRHLERALAGARGGEDAPEPRHVVAGAQPARTERAGRVGGPRRPRLAPDLVDPAVAPAVAVGADLRDEEAPGVARTAPAGAVVAQAHAQAGSEQRGQRRIARDGAALSAHSHGLVAQRHRPRGAQDLVLADHHRLHRSRAGGCGARGRARRRDEDDRERPPHRTVNTTRVVPRTSAERLPARSTAARSST